ncbi:hypothetical protein [Herminiimonas aquatilis]|uniref:DUF2486 family protein n=1 Tax=Herminiimonas aquatilis TaxID=345342 RepID=A0ABW2J797_9BURK
MNKSTQDSGIPVLTEVITAPPRAASTATLTPASSPLPPQASAAQYNFSPNQTFTPIPAFLMAPAAPTETDHAAVPTAATEYLADIPVLQVEIETPPAPIEHLPITGWLDEEWTRMEQKISERVLTQLLSRIDTVLEERLQQVLTASLQRATEEIRQGLQQTLGEVVSDAVAQEIDNLHFSKK